MITDNGGIKRTVTAIQLSADLVITGGGLAGVCCAITAAREGLQVILVQDRPVLGGNSSSEVRLWVLGATSHMGNNNRWAREGGVIDELLLENAYRNPEGNPLIFDTILLEKVTSEANITLLLNTAVHDLEKSGNDTIKSLQAFCSQNSTTYQLSAPLFCDASGDGILGFMAGAAFRMGAESKEEFDEKFAPEKSYGELLGHSLYFYSKDTGKPVRFVPPSFALNDITKVPRFRSFNTAEYGCRLWWLEYGGRLDTVHDTEAIKWELWKVVYGAWNYIKNSGEFPEAENLTLEWVGTIPGKRESRRFEGDYMLNQKDVINQNIHTDAVAFGGWSVDLHPSDGVFSEKPGCNQWHSKGIYGIPYRCYYSRNISNLFLAGRIISASHVAFGSSRVMATCAHGGQAVAMAATICKKYSVLPRQAGIKYIADIQLALLKAGQHIPHLSLRDPHDLVQKAVGISATSTLKLHELPPSDHWQAIDYPAAQMLPVGQHQMPSITFYARVKTSTSLQVELRKSSKPYNHSPDVVLENRSVKIEPGTTENTLRFNTEFAEPCYAFVCFLKNPDVELCYSNQRITGLLSVFNTSNPAVSNYGKQEPPEDIGVDAFEFWCPARRPGGQNIAMRIEPALEAFSPENLRNGVQRPVQSTNAWIAAYEDREPKLTISWPAPVTIKKLELFFDADYDHPLETVLMHNPETTMVYCADTIQVLNCNNEVVGQVNGNYLSRQSLIFNEPVATRELKIIVFNSRGTAPAALFEIRCYE
jgi:hypothetical protein